MQNNKDALSKQVGGDHYKKQAIQPIELAYILNASPCFTKLAKYITRDKGDRNLDLEKTIHVIELEEGLSCFETEYGGREEDFVNFWINKFTDDLDIRSALLSMYFKDYQTAITHTKGFIASLDTSPPYKIPSIDCDFQKASNQHSFQEA